MSILASALLNYAHSLGVTTTKSNRDINDQEWIIVDVGKIWIHIFLDNKRTLYQIEDQYQDDLININDSSYTKILKKYHHKDQRIVSYDHVQSNALNDDEGIPMNKYFIIKQKIKKKIKK